MLSDPTQYLFFEKGIRGGVSTITKRYAKANNKDLQEDYNQKLPSNYLLYLDCNNLYGVALSDYLPTGDFKWLTEEEISILNVSNLPEDNDKGYIIECDLEYSTDLHASRSDYPLAPERMVVSDEMLSAHSNKMWRDIQDHYTSEIKRTKTSKLIPNLYNKKNYVVHYRSLKQYISLGLKLTKIHRVLEFSQAAFLKPYIDLNTAKRAQAKNDWEKIFYKLMNNAVFGKTLENLRNRVDVKLAHTEKKLKKLVAKSFLKRFEILNENLKRLNFNQQTYLHWSGSFGHNYYVQFSLQLHQKEIRRSSSALFYRYKFFFV